MMEFLTDMMAQIHSKKGASGVSEVLQKFAGINVLNAKGTILKKINVSFSVHFCYGKYSSTLDTFLTLFLQLD